MANNLSIKNLFIAFVALNLFSLVLMPRLPDGMPAAGTFSSSSRNQAPDPSSTAAQDAASRHLAARGPTRTQRQPSTVVKVLDLPDSEALRFGDNTFVDLGWRQTAGKGGEWVGHIGSGTEYVPLNADQIAGILKEAQLKSLPLPPAPRAETPSNKPATAPPAPEEIDLAVSEALRNIEKNFADFGRQAADGNGGERVGQVGSDSENLPFSSDHIAGLLKDDLQPLTLPPVPRAVTPREKPATVPPASKGIDLLGFIPMLMGIFFMMYIRYRITHATLEAAQGAAGLAQRALSQILSAAKAKAPAAPAASKAATVRAPIPVGMSAPIKNASRSSTVVRPAPGLFGIMMRSR